MGMDVMGIEPKSETGEYFRANCWSWRPLHHLIAHVAEDIIDEETLMSMSFNDGAGLDDEDSQRLATRISLWLEHNVNGVEMEDTEGGFRVYKEVSESGGHQMAPDDEDRSLTMNVYRTSDEHISEFVDFLRHCGGFGVY